MLKKIEIMIMITISYNDLQIRLISQSIKKGMHAAINQTMRFL